MSGRFAYALRCTGRSCIRGAGGLASESRLQEMTVRKNDLAVFDMILMMTQCPDAMLLQANSIAKVELSANTKPLRVCQHKCGLSLKFDDPKLPAKIEAMTTLDARNALEVALGQVVASKRGRLKLLQTETGQPSAGEVDATTGALPNRSVETLPVVEEPTPNGQLDKCVDGPVNCGLLHDLMSMEWGKFRDAFDAFAAEMELKTRTFDKNIETLSLS